MSFFRRKKEEGEKKSILGLPTRKKDEVVKKTRVVGEVLKVFLREEENIRVEKEGKFSYSGTGEMKVESVAESPIYSIELNLEGLENTTFKNKRVFIPTLTKVNDVYKWTQEYELKKRNTPSIEIKRALTSDGGEALLVLNKPSVIHLTMFIKNNLNVDIDTVKALVKVNEGTKLLKHLEDNGYVSFDRDALIWDKIKLPAGGEAKLEADFEITVENIESIIFGETLARYSVKDNTISGLRIIDVKGKGKVKYSIFKNKREKDPAYWDCIVKLENENDYPLKVIGKLKPKNGEIIKEESTEVEGVKIGKNVIELKDLTLAPTSAVNIGPIALKCDNIPQFEIDITGEVKGLTSLEASGKIEVSPIELKVIGGEINKTIETSLEDVYESILKEDEIPSIGKTPINVKVEIENTGSIPMSYVKIEEFIPKGFSSPEKVKIEIGGRNVTKSFKTSIEPNNQIDNDRTYILETVNTKEKSISLKPKEKLVLSYIIYAEKPLMAGKFIRFQSKATIGTSASKGLMELELPSELVPRVKVKPISYGIEVSQDVKPVGEDEFEVKILVENKGDIPVSNYEIKTRIPKTFNVISHSIQPTKTEEKAKETIIIWKLELIKPKEIIEITYNVKGLGDYRLEDLLKISEG